MGKSKARKTRPAADLQSIDSPVSHPLCTCGHSHETVRAADGHNVEGWTNEDIRIYNELLTERAKLEKEKNELEQKSARHQAERALLNEDAAAFDNLFKVQLSGEYKFTGSSACCLNFSGDPIISKNKCHHEICSRAKSQGVSWMELDTIKYYQTRIASERSARMKNALQKQRDVELERVKKDDDEELALRNRRSAMLDKVAAKNSDSMTEKASGKNSPTSTSPALKSKAVASAQKGSAVLDAMQDNETVIRRLNVKMDKIRRDFQTGKVSASDAKLRMEEVNKEMDQATKQSEHFREMILGTASSQDLSHPNSSLSRALSASLASSSKDAFSQALNVIKGFISASDQRGVQAAISDFRSILEITSPMASSQYKSLRSLDELNSLPNAKGFSRRLVNHANELMICTNIEQVFVHLREAEDHTVLQAAARELKIDASLAQANEAAIEVERQALVQIIDVMNKSMLTKAAPRETFEALQSIKQKAVRDSPLPPMTELVTSLRLDWALPTQLALALWTEGKTARQNGVPVDERALAAQLISAFMVFSQKKPENYLTYFRRIEGIFEERRELDRGLCTILFRVAEDVKTKARDFFKKAIQTQQNHDRLPQGQDAKGQISRLEKSQGQSAQEENTETQKCPTQMSNPRNPKATVDSKMTHSSLSADGSPASANKAVVANAKAQSILNALGKTGSPSIKQMFDYLARGNQMLSPATLRHLQEELEAIMQQPADDKKLSPQAQEQLAVLADQYLSTFAKQASPSKEPQNNAGKSTKVTIRVSAKTSKFHEDLSTMSSQNSQIDTSANPATKSSIYVSSEDQTATAVPAGHTPSGPGENNTSSPPPYIANEGRARSAVKVNHVAVNTPRISGSSPSPVKGSADPTAAHPASTPAPATPDVTSRQSAIRNQLMAMRGNLDQLKIRAEPPAVLSADGLGLKDPFEGIVGKIEQQYQGHIAMAKEIANANEWNRLSKWLGKRG